MLEKYRHPGSSKSLMKNLIAFLLMAVTVVIFALFRINTPSMGGGTGGAAAVVNNHVITLKDFNQREARIEQQLQSRLEQVPDAQRETVRKQLQRRTLEQMILGELIYQGASHGGVLAPDGQVRDYIVGIPLFQQKGRFIRERYQEFLANSGQSAESFENQIRQDIVTQRIQELFNSALAPSTLELKRLSELQKTELDVKFAEISRDQLDRTSAVSDSEAAKFLADSAHQKKVQDYYNDHRIEFTHGERVKARHILIAAKSDKEFAAALTKAKKIRKELTTKNFASLAKKYSDDPGSKAKGGELGYFERGHMVPQFEQAAFSLKPGEISQPIRSSFGYHIIYVEDQQPQMTKPFEKVKVEIAKKLIGDNEGAKYLADLKTAVETKNIAEIARILKVRGAKWENTGKFDLAEGMIPKIGSSPTIFKALGMAEQKPGLIPELVQMNGRYVVMNVISWKESSKPVDETKIAQTVTYRKMAGAFDSWAESLEKGAKIRRNNKLFE